MAVAPVVVLSKPIHIVCGEAGADLQELVRERQSRQTAVKASNTKQQPGQPCINRCTFHDDNWMLFYVHLRVFQKLWNTCYFSNALGHQFTWI